MYRARDTKVKRDVAIKVLPEPSRAIVHTPRDLVATHQRGVPVRSSRPGTTSFGSSTLDNFEDTSR